MSIEAPKKIWVDEKWEAHPRGPLIQSVKVTPYIRADIVEELREALEKLAKLGNGDHYGNSVGNDIAKAALARLEDV